MCGIAGFIDHHGTSGKDELQKMTDSLSHRGPDSNGYELYKAHKANIGFGHRRLSIIDLSNGGAQPMQRNGLHIVFNGEIYNYKVLRSELQQAGLQFTGDSDTEVLLQAYQHWGTAAFNKLKGMFAFVIYDPTKQLVICVRDRIGVKPFFYYKRNHIFLFSSELKAFHQHPSFQKELDHDSVASFIQTGVVPTPRTIFKQCHKLQAGHFLQYDIKTQQTQIEKYWDIEKVFSKPKLHLSLPEAKKKLQEKLTRAFKWRMVADVPVGIFLSGGYDSTLLTAILQQQSNSKLRTYTISVPDIGLNEAPFAKEIAGILGTEHHEFACTEKEAVEILAQLPHIYDEPFGDPSAIPTSLLSKTVRKDTKVILSADGGDELFAGYNRYDVLMRYRSFLQHSPAIANKFGSFMLRNFASHQSEIYSSKYTRSQKMLDLLKNPSLDNIIDQLNIVYTNSELKDVLSKDLVRVQRKYQHEPGKKQSSDLSYMMALDMRTYLLDDILVKVDRASMAFGLEAREPYLDNELIEFAATLPDEMKYNKGVKKFILKELTHQFVPKEVMDRPKMGFSIPLAKWLSNDLRYLLEEYISEQLITKQGIFNYDHLKILKQRFLEGDKALALKLWYHIVFQMWYKKWM